MEVDVEERKHKKEIYLLYRYWDKKRWNIRRKSSKIVKKTFKGDKKKIKKLQDWMDYVGANPGKCKPQFYYFSMGKNEQKNYVRIVKS